jgi:hypothetical protein
MTTGSMVNAALPQAALLSLDGMMVDFRSYQGKKLIIFMWASW